MSELSLTEGQFAHVEVYTDGGCDPNPGPGGWAAIIRREGREWVLQGNDPDTTNNRMELQAAAARHHVTWRLVVGEDVPPGMERAAQLAADKLAESQR